MSTTSPTSPTISTPSPSPIRGTIVEAEVKISVDPGMPLPLACALYAIETPEGVWLCAYYGANRSNFEYLPQKGAAVDESKLGIAFHTKKLVSRDQFTPALWDEFKKAHLMAYGGHAG
jgi:hypothetical protein